MTQGQRPSRRDHGITALIEGFFGFVWFGWGQADATSALLQALLAAGSALSLVVAALGGVIAFRSPAGTGALHERPARRSYGILVGVEFALAGVGAAALGALGQSAYIPVWVCAVVGTHFFPLSAVLGDRLLPWLGALVTAVAVVALGAGPFTGVAPSTVAGLGAGVLLVAFATLALAAA
jgi:hypothetical protein